jgi:hypothetical protein
MLGIGSGLSPAIKEVQQKQNFVGQPYEFTRNKASCPGSWVEAF